MKQVFDSTHFIAEENGAQNGEIIRVMLRIK
jgi:hypothetical protein